MSGTSNVGNAGVYEAKDQRTSKMDNLDAIADKFTEGKINSHKSNDAKDERSIANRLENESKKDDENETPQSKEDELRKIDATLPALSHGNQPSKGAIEDQQMRDEEAEILKKKGAFGPSAAN